MKTKIILTSFDGTKAHEFGADAGMAQPIGSAHILRWNERQFVFSHKVHGEYAFEFVEANIVDVPLTQEG